MLDLQLEQRAQGQLYPEVYDGVQQLKRRYALHGVLVQPRDPLAVRKTSEREQIQELVKKFRETPPDQQRRTPALLNSLAQLQMLIGDFEAAQQDFDEVASLVHEHRERAEAHHNTYRATLEQRDWSEALGALLRACALSSATYEPFPLARYEPKSILGAGGFGVSFLCHDRASEELVVIRALRDDIMDRDAAVSFRELGWVRDLELPVLARVLDCNFADPQEQKRPYLVLEPTEGTPLDEYIRLNGPLPPMEALALLWPLARVLQLAHGRGVLHRSLRPGCVFVRRLATENEPVLWDVRLLDMSLSLKRPVLHAAASNPEVKGQTTLGRSVTQTIAFAPPELVSKPKGLIWVGPHSDIYAWGRLAWFVLTGKSDPGVLDPEVPNEWRTLLNHCTQWTLNKRPDQMGFLLDRMAEFPGAEGLIERIEKQLHQLQVEVCTRILAKEPEQISALLNRAQAHAQWDNYDAALEDYARALHVQPRDAGILRRRAGLHLRRGDLEAALEDYTRALEIDPRHLDTYTRRAQVHARRFDYEAAIADYSEVIRASPRDAEAHFNRGNAHYCRSDYDAAILDYTTVLRLDPRNQWAYGNRGKCHALKGEFTQAITDFTHLLRLDPENVRGYADRGAAYASLKQFAEAIADFSRAIDRAPTAFVYAERGLALAAQGKHTEALPDFDRALELEPANGRFFMYRGNSYCDLRELDKSLADLDRAVELVPELGLVYYNRGNVHALRGNHREAVADYSLALDKGRSNGSVYFNRANSHVELQDYEAALADYTKALEFEPDDTAIFVNRGNTRSTLGQYEEARADFDEAVKRRPDDQAALFNRATALQQLGLIEQALTDLNEVIRLHPAHARAFYNRAGLLGELGRMDEALADYTQALTHHPTYVRAFNSRGNLLAELRRFDEAIRDYTQALTLDPAYELALYNRGSAHAERGDDDAAILDFTAVLILHPDHVGALNNRGNALSRQGRVAAALDDFNKAIERQPTSATPWFNRAVAQASAGALEAALADYTEAIRLNPRDLAAYHNRGKLQLRRGDWSAALNDNLAALQVQPNDVRTCNNLAWLWAACPVDSLRDPARALEQAQAACAATEYRNAAYLDTLAVAYAASGDFAAAIEWQTKAVELAEEAQKADYQARLDLYRAGQPFRAREDAQVSP